MQPQRTILISLNCNVLLWDNEGHGNYLPRIPLVQELVSCKHTLLFLCQEKWEVDRLGIFLQEHIRLLNSVEIWELVCYLAWGIFYHNERLLFLYALGSFPCSSQIRWHTLWNMVWKSTSNHLGNLVRSTNWGLPFLILCLAHTFLKLILDIHLSKRGTEVLGKNEWDRWMIWKPEIYRNLQILDERNNALCFAFVPFPHCLTVIDYLEFGENFSNSRQSLHCILFPSLFRSYCDLGPRRLISGSYPSNSSFRWIPLHVGELPVSILKTSWPVFVGSLILIYISKYYFFVISL